MTSNLAAARDARKLWTRLTITRFAAPILAFMPTTTPYATNLAPSASIWILPVLPDQGPNTDTTRPADLLITGLSNRPIAVDFSITHALQPSLRLADVPPGKAALKIEKTKVRDRTPGCRQMGWDFVPFVVEAIEAIRTSTGCNSYYHL